MRNEAPSPGPEAPLAVTINHASREHVVHVGRLEGRQWRWSELRGVAAAYPSGSAYLVYRDLEGAWHLHHVLGADQVIVAPLEREGRSPLFESGPRAAPTGDWIAWPLGERQAIEILRPDGSLVRRIATHGQAHSLGWSWSGRRLGYLVDTVTSPRLGLSFVDQDEDRSYRGNGEPEVLAANLWVGDVRWSFDDSMVLFAWVGRFDGPLRRVMSSEGGAWRSAPLRSTWDRNSNLLWEDTGEGRLTLVAPDGATVGLPHPYDGEPIAWAPDGLHYVGVDGDHHAYVGERCKAHEPPPCELEPLTEGRWQEPAWLQAHVRWLTLRSRPK